MNNAAHDGGGGGASSDFDWQRFYSAAGEIEKCLGYLKGNELVVEYLTELKARAEEATPVGPTFFEWKSPADEYPIVIDQFAVSIPATGEDVFPEDLEPVLGQVEQDLTASFENGRSWAQGIQGYLAQLVEPMTEVSVSGLGSLVTEMKNISLWSLLPADFAKDVTRGPSGDPVSGVPFGATLENWAGDSSEEFQTFYATLSDLGARYTVAMSSAADWVDGTGALIGSARTGLLDLLDDVVDDLRTHLAQWEIYNWTPNDIEPYTGKLPAIVEIGSDIISVIPVIDKILPVPRDVTSAAGAVEDGSTVLGLIDKYVNEAGDAYSNPVEFVVQTAEEIYTELTGCLTDDFLTPLREALDRLAAERSAPTIAQIEGLADELAWYPYPVPSSIRRDDWSFKDPPLL